MGVFCIWLRKTIIKIVPLFFCTNELLDQCIEPISTWNGNFKLHSSIYTVGLKMDNGIDLGVYYDILRLANPRDYLMTAVFFKLRSRKDYTSELSNCQWVGKTPNKQTRNEHWFCIVFVRQILDALNCRRTRPTHQDQFGILYGQTNPYSGFNRQNSLKIPD